MFTYIYKRLCIFVTLKAKKMFEQPKFKIIYSEEVIDFLNSLNEKVKEKIIFNINKSKYVIDNDLFKKLKGSDIWEFRTKYSQFTESLHFGIQRMIH